MCGGDDGADDAELQTPGRGRWCRSPADAALLQLARSRLPPAYRPNQCSAPHDAALLPLASRAVAAPAGDRARAGFLSIGHRPNPVLCSARRGHAAERPVSRLVQGVINIALARPALPHRRHVEFDKDRFN
jgi:hypothetical protein